MPHESVQQDEFAHLEIMNDIAQRSRHLISEFALRHSGKVPTVPEDALNLNGAYSDLAVKMMSDPSRALSHQMDLWKNFMGLWQYSAGRMMGLDVEPQAEPAKGDRRFKDPAWSENHVLDYIKQSYLLTAGWLESLVNDVDGIDPKTAHKIEFFTRCYIEAMSPANFALSNPEVMRETLETKGENLLRGLQNLLADFERGNGKLNVRMSDERAFEVGVTVAATPGKVVYRNELIELIQYEPSTKTVYKRPLLIVPPWINKYYVLDLSEKNSYVKWAVAQGHTVFVVSWVNPGKELADKDFVDYMHQGPLDALVAIEKATGERAVNVVGYCIGGTLLAATGAWIAAPDNPERENWQGRIASQTYLTTLTDFQDVGDVSVFIDEAQVSKLEKTMNERGYLEGREMGAAFNLMRSSDLIWSFVINNYLMGKSPFPFDLLYWNNDSTQIPAALHSYYLRKMNLENRLSQPGGLDFDGVAIDLRDVELPTYMVSAHDDHIAPWASTFKATDMFKGDMRFVLAASGHIAGIINPPANKKYHFWTNESLGDGPQNWLDGAQRHEGSWWSDWAKWAKKQAGTRITARIPGAGELAALENAPGSYVMVRYD